MPRTTRPAWIAGALPVGLVLGAWLFLFREALFEGLAVLGGDLGNDMWPSRRLFVFLASHSAGLPSWNPFFSAGQPFAANPQHAVFHPLTGLFLVLPFAWAFRLQVLVPPLVAAASMWFLLREAGRSAAARLLGAVGWAFGGYVLSQGTHLPGLFPAAVLPAALGWAVRLGRRPRPADVAGLALFFGLEALSGEPTSLVCTVLLAASALALGRRQVPADGIPRGPLLPRLGLLAAALALGAVVGAAALLPASRLFSATARATGLPAGESGEWSLPPLRFAELAVPDLTDAGGSDPATAGFRASLYPGRTAPLLASLYPGLLVTALALYAFAQGTGGVRVFLPVLAVGALLSPGVHTPLFGTAHTLLPAFSATRFPEKFVLLILVPVTIAAGFGLDALRAAPARHRRLLAGVLLVFGAGAAVAASILWGSRGPSSPAAWMAGQLARTGAVAATAGVLAALLGRAPRGATAGILLLTAGDLAGEGRRLLPCVPVEQAEAPPPVLRRLLAAPPAGYLFHLASFHPGLHTLPGLGVPPKPAQFGIATALDRDWGVTQLAWSARAVHAVWRALSSDPALSGPLLSRRGISTLIRFRPGTPPPEVARRQSPLDLVEILTLPDPQPLVFAAETVRLFGSEDEWLTAARLAGPSLRATVFIEREAWGDAPRAVSPARVALETRGPDRLSLLVDAAGPHPALLAVNQTWDSCWHALLDGAEVPFLLADFDLGALRVPPGRHRVELRYEDPLLGAGVALTLLALGLCLILALRP